MSISQSFAGIILAAGKGTRMRSSLPKCLFSVCGIPMAEHVVRAMAGAGVSKPIMVIGHQGEMLQAALGDSCQYAWQREQLGTGHAVQQALLLPINASQVVIAAGDTPLVEAALLSEFLRSHAESGAVCSVGTTTQTNPHGYGRIIRSQDGSIQRIVEERDATSEVKAICEINTGLYVFDLQVLTERLPTLSNSNSQGEYYLTDVVAALASDGIRVGGIAVDPKAALGVNDRWQLASVESYMRLTKLRSVAESGVTIKDPSTTYLDVDVTIGEDSTLEPNVIIRGRTVIGEGALIGPGSFIQDSQIGKNCRIVLSQIVRANLADGVKVGPFANLRPGADLQNDVKIGNFVEIKNANLGQGVAASHLTYLGDATVGAGTNIGAGTITCNYDGFSKHRTDIGEDVFVGSNSTLVAPLTIGDGAFVAAGSVVNKDVEPDALAVGRARQENKEGWVSQWRKRKL